MIGRSFLCAMLRRAADKTEFIHTSEMKSHIEIEAGKKQQSGDRQLRSDAEAYVSLKAKVEEFEKYSGINLTYAYTPDIKDIGEAVRVIKNKQIDGIMRNLERMSDSIKQIQDGLTKNINELKQQNEQSNLTRS